MSYVEMVYLVSDKTTALTSVGGCRMINLPINSPITSRHIDRPLAGLGNTLTLRLHLELGLPVAPGHTNIPINNVVYPG